MTKSRNRVQKEPAGASSVRPIKQQATKKQKKPKQSRKKETTTHKHQNG